jgi:hypothetical protein
LIINCITTLFIAYLLFIEPNQLATATNTWATNLAVFCIAGMVVLTAISAYFKFLKQMPGVAIGVLILSWLFMAYCIFVFLSKQKWM